MTRTTEQSPGGLVDLMHEIAADHGERPALLAPDRQWTHAELWTHAEAVALGLSERGISPGERVGVLVAHDVADVLALTGLARLGAAAVPVDPATPPERLAFVLGDAGCRHLLARPEHAEELVVDGLSRHDLEQTVEGALSGRTGASRGALDRPDASAAAYVIYTSGSTGRPKGVEVSAGALAAHARSVGRAWGLRPEDRTLQFASLGFDVAQEELWATWAHGGCLVLNPEGVTTFADLAAHVRRHQVSVLQVPTAFWRVLVADPTIEPGPVRLVVIGSEAAWRDDLVRWRASAWAGTDLINAYGPTEAVITATSFRLAPDTPLPEGPGVPVGHPLPERSAWVRREDGSLTADPGAEGDLLVSGILAEGYLGRPDLTAERFPSRLDGREGPFYDTGDRVRVLADGALEFLGRTDGQVKVRGFRIELEEIDAALGSAPGVALGATALLTRAGAEPSLGALVVAEAGGQPDTQQVRDHLARRLPAYMVPVRLAVGDEVPRTVNGKIDREAVAALVASVPAASVDRTDVTGLDEPTATLLPLWRSVLGDDTVGPDDDFFSLGGDSLLVMQFTARARGAGWAVAPRSVLRGRTLRRVSALATPVTEQEEASAALELLPAQHRWLRDGPLPDMGHFALVALFETGPRLTREQVVSVAAELLRTHPTLRSRLRAVGDRLSISAGKARAERAVNHHEVDRLDPETVERLCVETQQDLSPGAGRVLRLVLMDDAHGSQRLLLAAHHLTLDGWSMALLVEDLEHLVRQVVAGHEARLPAPPAGPGDLARAYRELAAGDVATWTSGWLDLAWAEVRHHPREADGEALLPSLTFARRSLAAPQTASLLRGDGSGTRVVDAVQAAILTALAERTGHPVQGLDVYSHNRDTEEIDLDLSRTIGYVQATHPVVRRVEGASAADLRELARTMAGSTPPPFTFDLVRFLDGDAGAALRALPALDVRLNYRGHLDRLEERATDSPLQAADEPTGPNRARTQRERYLLMFEGDIVGDRLEISLKHSTDLFSSASADDLVARVVAHLEILAGGDV